MEVFEVVYEDVKAGISQNDVEFLKSFCGLAEEFCHGLDCPDIKFRGSVEDEYLNVFIILVNCFETLITISDKAYQKMCSMTDKVSFMNAQGDHDGEVNYIIIAFSKKIE